MIMQSTVVIYILKSDVELHFLNFELQAKNWHLNGLEE